jgi:hypothetical protein
MQGEGKGVGGWVRSEKSLGVDKRVVEKEEIEGLEDSKDRSGNTSSVCVSSRLSTGSTSSIDGETLGVGSI